MIKRQLVGIYQLITGIFGFLFILINIGKAFEHKGIMFTVFLGLFLFACLAISGLALIKDYKNSVKYAIISQGIQSVGIIYNGTQYLFTGSAFLTLQVGSKGVQIQTQISPIAYNISEVIISIPFELKVFIVPLILILILSIKK